MPSDRDMIERAATLIAAIATRGDREAFATLFAFYAPRIKALLMRQGAPADVAEELAQETMLAVWRKAASFDPARASAGTWMFAIARNLRIDRMRRERAVPAQALYDVLQGEAPKAPGDAVEGAERDDRVRAALQELSSEQMSVVRLSYYESKPHADIAQALGIPLGTVKSRLRLAMARLRERLEDLS